MKFKLYSIALIVAAAMVILCNDNLFASDSDNRIAASAKQSYVFKTYLKNDDITVISKNGVVTLTGTVADESNKILAKETVASLSGVKSVDNQLTLSGKKPASNSDTWLMAKVKSTLLFHRNVDATRTNVIAANGIVTLRGEATSEAQKDLTAEYAKDVDGVKGIKNEMTLIVSSTTSNKQAIDDKRIGETTMGQKLDIMNEAIDDASTSALVKTTLLLHHSTSAINTTVNTKEGVVTLGGKAINAAEKDLASKLVSDVYGVKRVVNNMTVATDTKSAPKASVGDYLDDTVITSKVKAAIVNEPSLQVLQIKVESSDGVVQLNGVVDSTTVSAKATEVTAAVKGVKGVTNNLTVK